MKKIQKKSREEGTKTNNKKDKTNKLLGIFVMIGGALSLVIMIVFATKFALTPTNTKKPVLGVAINGAPANTNFKDPTFYACIINELNDKNINEVNDRGYTHEATENELELMTELSCHYTIGNNKITDTSGLELMKNLKGLFLSDNEITSIDLSGNTKLESLNLAQNNLTSIDLKPIRSNIKEIVLDQNKNLVNINWGTSFNKLEKVHLQETSIENINVFLFPNIIELSLVNNPNLTEIFGFFGNKVEKLKLSNTGIKTIHLSGALATSLKTLWLDNTPELTHASTQQSSIYGDIETENGLNGIRLFSKLEELKISKSKITNIDFTANTEIDISGTPSLKNLWIEDMPSLTSIIGLESATTLQQLTISGTSVNSLDASNNTKLTNINLSNNNLATIVLSSHPDLRYLDLSGNKLMSVDMTNNTKLRKLSLSNNPDLTSLALGNNTNVTNNLLLTDSPLLSNVTLRTGSSDFEFNPNLYMLKIDLGYTASHLDSGILNDVIRTKRALTGNSNTITSIRIADVAGNILPIGSTLKTGDIVQGIYDGGTVDLELYSLGDVVPDGEVTFGDVLKIFHYSKGMQVMNSAAEVAASDTVADGKIEFNDALKAYHYTKGAINELQR